MSSSSSSSRDLVGELNLNLFQDQRLRDFRLSIEYKYLQGHAPGGVFILPELDDIRTMHGVVFVRRGLYRNGVFRFTLKLPKEYVLILSLDRLRLYAMDNSRMVLWKTNASLLSYLILHCYYHKH